MSTDETPADHWWRTVEEEVAKRNADLDLPDPWAEAVPEAPELTDDQRDLLLGLDDQPRVARLTQLDPDAESHDEARPDVEVDDSSASWHEGFDLGDDPDT